MALKRILVYLLSLFNLRQDAIEREIVIKEIEEGVRFRGKNLWILIFAIFIASLGLNVNSTAVIIGAMLISPLMGPIMGMGLGLGIYNLQLLKDSARNYLVAAVIGLLTSTFYFAVSPLYGNPSELLSRTSPTVYDVLIALFGGLAGIVATSSKDNRGNVIPGVAIATALMPPLCTAGFGIAQGNLYYFLGAFYLFFINTVFICLATYMIVRLMKFPFHSYTDPRKQSRIRQLVTLIAVVTLIPSILVAYRMVSKDIFERRANQFVKTELTFPGSFILGKNIDYPNRTIELTVIGKKIAGEELTRAKSRTGSYGLENTTVTINQEVGDTVKDLSVFRQQVTEDLYNKTLQLVSSQGDRIRELEDQVNLTASWMGSTEVYNEAKALFPGIIKVSISRALMENLATGKTDTTVIGYFDFKTRPSATERKQIAAWLEVR